MRWIFRSNVEYTGICISLSPVLISLIVARRYLCSTEVFKSAAVRSCTWFPDMILSVPFVGLKRLCSMTLFRSDKRSSIVQHSSLRKPCVRFLIPLETILSVVLHEAFLTVQKRGHVTCDELSVFDVLDVIQHVFKVNAIVAVVMMKRNAWFILWNLDSSKVEEHFRRTCFVLTGLGT